MEKADVEWTFCPALPPHLHNAAVADNLAS